MLMGIVQLLRPLEAYPLLTWIAHHPHRQALSNDAVEALGRDGLCSEPSFKGDP